MIEVPAWLGSGEVPCFGLQTAIFSLDPHMEERDYFSCVSPKRA